MIHGIIAESTILIAVENYATSIARKAKRIMKQIKKEIYKCQLCGTVQTLDVRGQVKQLHERTREIPLGMIVEGSVAHECYKDKTKEGFDNKIGVMKLIGFEMED